MKKFVCLLLIVGIFGFLALIPTEAKGCWWGWVLYDDFNSNMINDDLWDIDISSADISVVNGLLRIEHFIGHEGDPSGLLFKVNPAGIKAAMVKVMVESAEGHLQARIGGNIGEEQDGTLIFKRVAARNDVRRIDCWAGQGEYTRHYAQFRNPIDILRVFFEIGMNFNRMIFTSWAKDFGKNFFTPQRPLPPSSQPQYKQIGTRSESGNGSGVVWFDNIYVRYR